MLHISLDTLELPPFKRVMGLDIGEKTIGLAISDITRMIATPLETISRGKFTADAQKLQSLIGKHEIAALILGYPVNMDGSLGPRTQSVRAFASNLEKHVTIPMALWDERMSTMAVTRTMLDADLSRERRAELVDKMAASYILQGAIDYLSRRAK